MPPATTGTPRWRGKATRRAGGPGAGDRVSNPCDSSLGERPSAASPKNFALAPCPLPTLCVRGGWFVFGGDKHEDPFEPDFADRSRRLDGIHWADRSCQQRDGTTDHTRTGYSPHHDGTRRSISAGRLDRLGRLQIRRNAAHLRRESLGECREAGGSRSTRRPTIEAEHHAVGPSHQTLDRVGIVRRR